MTWISKLLEATEDAETPRSYIYWAGISVISAIIAPNVYINRGGKYLLQPNTFIFLIGESGLGKGLPLNIAKKLVKIVNSTRIIDGSNTIQSIIYELGNSETDLKTGIPKWKDSRGFIVSGEFATLLQDDKLALPALTELYDTHYVGGVEGEDWNKKTKSSGKDKLIGTCVTLFAGSTSEHFQNTVPEHDVKGGFVGRLLTVYEEKRYKINPLSDTKAEKIPFDNLSGWLSVISKLKGPFDWADERTKKYWEEWYTDIKNPGRKIHDPTGAINRLPDNILKVAMCLSLARQFEQLVISYEDLEEAIEKCMSLTIDSRRLTGGKGKSQVGEQVHFVTQVLYRAAVDKERVTKGMLLRKYYGQFDLYELDRIISTLEAADLVKSIPLQGPPVDVLLEMPENAVKNIQAFMQKRQL
jgi:hypothetical protein